MNEQIMKEFEGIVNGLTPEEKDECLRFLFCEAYNAKCTLGRVKGFAIGAGIGIAASYLKDVVVWAVNRRKEKRKKKSEEITD